MKRAHHLILLEKNLFKAWNRLFSGRGVRSVLRTTSSATVLAATLVPEADEVEENKLEKEIREEVEKVTIPWVKEILKVTISDYLFQTEDIC